MDETKLSCLVHVGGVNKSEGLMVGYGALGHVPRRLPTIFSQLTSEPHAVYNSRLYPSPNSSTAMSTYNVTVFQSTLHIMV